MIFKRQHAGSSSTAQPRATPPPQEQCNLRPQHMKPARPKGSQLPQYRRSMPAMVGSAATILAMACSMPPRCCQAFRVSHSGGSTSYQLRGMAATSRGSRTARIARPLMPGVVGRRDATSAAAEMRSASYGSSSFVRNSLTAATGAQAGRRSRALAAPGTGTVRMVSDESQFFSDPDAPTVVEGEGPPGPLVGGDQVGPCNHQQLKLVATRDYTRPLGSKEVACVFR